MRERDPATVDIEDTGTWTRYAKRLCRRCRALCCSLPVEVKAADLVCMGLMDAFELEEDLKLVARRLKKARVVEHYHHRSGTFTLARLANGDCLYLNGQSRQCTIYARRPETCRNHPRIGPRPGYCPFFPQTAGES